MVLIDTTGMKIEVTNWDYSDTHFEGIIQNTRLKGRKSIFLKTRPYRS